MPTPDLSKLLGLGNGNQGSGQARSATATPPRPATISKATPFLDTTGKRNYSLFSRLAFDFLRRHYPPRIDTAYWQTHSLDAEMPPAEADYWNTVGDDMVECMRQAGTTDDAFLISLLWGAADELTRESKRLRQEAANTAAEEMTV